MRNLSAYLIVFAMLLGACNQRREPGVYSSDELKDDVDEVESVALEPEHNAPESLSKNGITLKPFTNFAEMPKARLQLNAPKDKQVTAQNEVNFDFTVSNFKLGQKSPKADEIDLAQSENGQHIHLIVNNGPYSAHYQSKFAKTFEAGTHYALAFLSRSYHLSLKNPEAYQAFQFTVKEAMANQPKLYPLNEPMLFYSRPKGTYSGKQAQELLFDFYLINAELAADGYSVLATINGNTTFEIDEWLPFTLTGLPMGENTITLELVDAQGRPVNANVNRISRTFTLKS